MPRCTRRSRLTLGAGCLLLVVAAAALWRVQEARSAEIIPTPSRAALPTLNRRAAEPRISLVSTMRRAEGCNPGIVCADDMLAVSVASGEHQHADPFKPVGVCVRTGAGAGAMVDYTSVERGMHVISVAPGAGGAVQRRVFDTYRWPGTDLAAHLSTLASGSLVIVTTHDDAHYSLGDDGIDALAQLGSKRVRELNFRGNLAFVTRVGSGRPLDEALERAPHNVDWAWGSRAALALCVPLRAQVAGHKPAGVRAKPSGRRREQTGVAHAAAVGDESGVSAVAARQAAFCAAPGRADTFAPLCAVDASALVPSKNDNLLAATFPVVVVASAHRPARLMALLLSLARQPGLDFALVNVYVDGGDAEALPRMVAQVFGARVVEFPKFVSSSTMDKTFQNADVIAAHYHRSLTDVWLTNERAPAVLVLEEDLTVSPDFLDYFSQTAPLLFRDDTLLTVSAWNDNGYLHAASDGAQLYRTSFFPGLGWLLTRTLWDELAPKWPACCAGWSWDLWLRLAQQTKNRDCIIPEVSRTFHAGSDGLNVDPYFFKTYFASHRLHNASAHVALRNLDLLTQDLYDAELTVAVTRAFDVTALAVAAAGSLSSCARGSLAAASVASVWGAARSRAEKDGRLMFYHQAHARDFATLQKLCACLGVWDLGDVRGEYHGVLVLRMHGAPLLLVGSASTYAATHVPPPHVLLRLHR